MHNFHHILNWKLKRGSHVFPGKDGGTCINEAAVIATGFPYRPVRSVEDMPTCFSRPICRAAMLLNDEASNKQRQLLLPFVTRLACADTADVEEKREIFIASCLKHRLSFWDHLTIFEYALSIGRQADPLPLDETQIRMDIVRRSASTRLRAASYFLLRKLKDCFGAVSSAHDL